MLGAVIGDIIGSAYEFNSTKQKDFELFPSNCRFTDDSVMTAAVAQACIEYTKDKNEKIFSENVVRYMQAMGKQYPDVGYGRKFYQWLTSANPEPYGSYGNGAAMRVSPVAYVAENIGQTEKLAEISAEVTHNHKEGIKGAKAVATAVYLALHGKSKEEIRDYIEKNYYKINFKLDEIRNTYCFDVSSQGSVPQALEAFFEGESYEDVVRNAVSLGGDADTMACIAGAVAEAYFRIPEDIISKGLCVIADTEINKTYISFMKQ